MMRVVFCLGVSVLLRLEYLLARAIVSTIAHDWSQNKVRIFAVRVVSFTHALISSVACICSLLSDSNYAKEPYDYTTYSAQFIFLFSMGYFIYDLLDMYIHGEAPYSKEYIMHHTLVLTAFSIILFTGKLFGFAMIGLLVEVQTVFLHLRTMIRLTGSSKKGSPLYNALISVNMACLFLFRHVPITFLLYFMLIKDEKCPLVLRTFLVAGLAFLEYHNIHLTKGDRMCMQLASLVGTFIKLMYAAFIKAMSRDITYLSISRFPISMVKADGFFGYEAQSLDEDHVDPLGPVKVKKSNK